MTWKDIKLATLQKMYSAEGSEIPSDDSTRDYIASMPFACNEGLQMICATRKPIIKYIDIDATDGEEAGNYMLFDISEFVEDFLDFEGEIYYTVDGNRVRLNDYYSEAHSVIAVPAGRKGELRIYYYAYPEVITSTTPDTYEFEAPMDVQVLLPLYMASQLYKEDDNSIATALRNEFEVAFERIAFNNPMIKQGPEYESGW